jgi:thiamine kinase-like enzyme
MIPNDEWLYKAWIFKADPVQTRKEMVIYYVASMNKVSTAKPLGYIPHQNESRYPYDIAILSGGPVEHAGMPYSELIYDVAIPRFVHNAAVEVAKLIADTHVRLTMQKSYIESFNVYLQPQKPDFEIRARLARGLGIYTENKFITTICQLCNAMYLQQRGSYVVSHCDLHTGNIVTKQKEDAESLRDFGLIDWGSTNLDHWEADLVDFFIHHKREALRANQKYNYDIKDLIKSYVNHFNATADSLGLEYNVSFDPRTLIIQSMLWNLYEMFDPTRTEPKDVMQKAIYHGSSFMRDLETLEHNGCKDIAREIRFSAQCLFHTTPGYGYMKAVVGHIGQASRRTFWPFAKFS